MTSEKRKRRNRTGVNIAAFDPSLTAWGWIVINTYNNKLIDMGVITTKPSPKRMKLRKGDDRVIRIRFICNSLYNLINKYKVSYIVSELPHGSQTANGAVMVGLVPGILEAVSTGVGIGLEWYYEGDIKKWLCGKRDASKEEVRKACEYDSLTSFINGQRNVPKYEKEATGDALAVYMHARKVSPYIIGVS